MLADATGAWWFGKLRIRLPGPFAKLLETRLCRRDRSFNRMEDVRLGELGTDFSEFRKC